MGEKAFENSLGFQAKNDGWHLKCCILRENPKNTISGRNVAAEK
jgi:hypothetical protein